MLWARKPAVVFGSLIWVSMFALTAAADPSTDQAEPLEAPAVAARLGDLEKLLPKLPRKEREALASFYGARGAATLWVDPNGWNAAAKSLIQRLTSADEDGLDPADYVLPAIAAARISTHKDWAEAELKLSAAAIAYARDARGARIDLPRLSNLIT